MPIRGANPNPKGEIGQVIASYGSNNVDLDQDGSQFVPDPERIEEVNRSLRATELRATYGKTALFALGGIAIAASAFFAIKAFRSIGAESEESPT